MTINEILNKLLDNANLGKAVADIGPGFALSFPLLMILSLVANFSIFPADRLVEIQKQKAAAIYDQQTAQTGFCALLKEQGDPCSKESPEEGAIKGRRRIAQLGVQVESYEERTRTAAKASKELPEKESAAGFALRGQYESLVTQKEMADEAAARVERYTNEETDAASLEFNVAGLSKNLSAVIAFSVVLGILVSQISHLLFIDLLFPRTAAVKAVRKPDIPVTMSKEDDELVKNYFRYVEGAINMVFPVLLTTLVFPTYAQQKLNVGISSALIYLSGVVVAAGLVLAAYNTYLSFIRKRAQLNATTVTPRVQ